MDKIDRLLDAMKNPDSYSSAEIEAMLQDPEVKEVSELLDKTKSSLQIITTPDIEDEWKRFEEKHRDIGKSRWNWLISLFSRNAAASIALALASFTAVAAIVGVGIHNYNTNRETTVKEIEPTTESVTIIARQDTIGSVEADTPKAVEIIVFDDESLENILNKIAGYYGSKVEFNNETSKSLRLHFRWNQENTLEEVVERLDNFEQIHIVIKDKTIKID